MLQIAAEWGAPGGALWRRTRAGGSGPRAEDSEGMSAVYSSIPGAPFHALHVCAPLQAVKETRQVVRHAPSYAQRHRGHVHLPYLLASGSCSTCSTLQVPPFIPLTVPSHKMAPCTSCDALHAPVCATLSPPTRWPLGIPRALPGFDVSAPRH